jgi:hypothetical protein
MRGPSCITWQISLIAVLQKQMEWLKRDEQLQETILNVIDNMVEDLVIPTNGPFRVALKEQQKIGWLGMLRGYWANAWQQVYVNTFHVSPIKEWKDCNKCLIQRVAKETHTGCVEHGDQTVDHKK